MGFSILFLTIHLSDYEDTDIAQARDFIKDDA
jgi:hypothetical protein